MIPSPPQRRKQRRAQAGLLTHGRARVRALVFEPSYSSPTLRRLPILPDSGSSLRGSRRISLPFTVAWAVADLFFHRVSRSPEAHSVGAKRPPAAHAATKRAANSRHDSK